MRQQEARAIDRRVATEVLGWDYVRLSEMHVERFWVGREHPEGPHTARVPRYSEEIAAAWTVLQRLQKLGWGCEIKLRPPFGIVELQLFEGGKGRWLPLVKANELPLAICAAALEWAERTKGKGKDDNNDD